MSGRLSCQRREFSGPWRAGRAQRPNRVKALGPAREQPMICPNSCSVLHAKAPENGRTVTPPVRTSRSAIRMMSLRKPTACRAQEHPVLRNLIVWFQVTQFPKNLPEREGGGIAWRHQPERSSRSSRGRPGLGSSLGLCPPIQGHPHSFPSPPGRLTCSSSSGVSELQTQLPTSS